MKRVCKFLLATIGLLSAVAQADAGDKTLLCFTNKSGVVYTNMILTRVLPDGLLLENASRPVGVVKVKFADLPDEVGEKYKASATAAAEKQQKDAAANAAFLAGQRKPEIEADYLRIQRQKQAFRAAEAAAAQEPIQTVEIPKLGWKIRFPNRFGHLSKEIVEGHFVCRGAGSEGAYLSIFVEPPAGNGSGHDDVYNHYWPKARRNPLIEPESIKMERKGKFVRVTYTVLGIPNANYYFAYKRKWVDVHVSSAASAKTAESLFSEFETQLSYD